ncbi:MAG TPA: ATP-binding protein, partial [Flavisolibacter sp.]|nr:ATP-binding protein [Flavisolibacter sp.]
EPLRKIRTFSGRLLDEFGRQIPDKGKVYLEKVQRSSERMTGMIDSVLNYSTVNVSEQRLETIDLNLMFEGIESDLELFILQKEARISYHGLPHIKAAPALIYQLFYNLIYNALKFSKADEASCIEVSAREMEPEAVENFSELQPADSYIRIMIKDNGIGFNQDYAEKMFQIFTRLNSRDRYEGTGLGLALCRKIVHRHGGIIYAEGREGIGAAFIIILPKK